MGAESEHNIFGKAVESAAKFVFPPKIERPTFHHTGEYEQGKPLEDYVVFFAGHGSPQVSGMEGALRQLKPIDALYDSINKILGYDLSELTNDQLKHTQFAQPAIAAVNLASCLTHEMAFPDELKNNPFTISGQSAGVVSAGWFAGMFGDRRQNDSAITAIRIAKDRGKIMQKMYNNPPSGHMLVAGGDRRNPATDNDLKALETIRHESSPREMPASLAIDISDSRIILGGTREALKEKHEDYKKRFGSLNLKYYDVPTSCVGFHGKVMEPISNAIEDMFESYRPLMQDPKYPILSNSYRQPRLITTVDEFIEEQVRLVTEPVFGRDMNRFLKDNKINTGLEFGERGIIAKSMDGFEISPRAIAIGGAVVTAGAVAIGTGYLVKRKNS